MQRAVYSSLVRSAARSSPLRSPARNTLAMIAVRANLRSAHYPHLLTRSFSYSRIIAKDTPSKDTPSASQHIGSIKVDKPQYMLAFTCKKCDHRSSHTISKQAYHHGTVMVKCPKCNNRHLIADHLKIFHDSHITIEDIMKAKGETVSQSTEDLVFDDIPESLKPLIGHYASDAPESARAKLDNSTVHTLPPPSKPKQ